ncbi:hypothetical protein JCM11251_007872 [Rhodosporidiobolus azoricus]
MLTPACADSMLRARLTRRLGSVINQQAKLTNASSKADQQQPSLRSGRREREKREIEDQNGGRSTARASSGGLLGLSRVLKTFFSLDDVFPTSALSQHSSFTPLLPPAIPLAVKSPYLNAWLPTGGNDGSKGFLAGRWARHWPIRYAESSRDHRLSWAGLIQVEGETYEFLGAPLSDKQENAKQARQTAFRYSATRSIFSFEAGGVAVNATFLSPVTPDDLVQQSLPLSYLKIDVDQASLRGRTVSVYTDISGEWATGENVELIWDYKTASDVGIHSISRKDPLLFAETAEQAEWGRAVYATSLAEGTTSASGTASSLRQQFIQNGRLNDKHDSRFRKVDVDQPVFGFSSTLSSSRSSMVYTIGHMREPYVNFVTPSGQLPLSGLWTTKYRNWRDAVTSFQKSASHTFNAATRFDVSLREDALRVSGESHAAIVELSTRQAFATFELTTGVSEDWKEDQNGALAFLKEISSNGDCSTGDVIFPLHPVLLYTSPKLLKLLLDPLLIYTHSGLYPNRYPVHDLGRYPNATGYNKGDDEPMPVEEAGNMLWMALAYYQATGDKAWIEKNYDLFKQWTGFLLDEGLIPGEQLSTDDFAGTLANQTNLAVKAIVGIGAMGELAKQTGHFTDAVHYSATAKAYVQAWLKLALTGEGGATRAKLAYQDEQSWGLLYNLFGDRLLNLNLFDHKLYKQQSEWYQTKAERYGVPLDSRHAWTKSDWEVFAAASAIDKQGREFFFDLLVKYLKAGKVDAGFPDLYESPTADFPGRDNLDWPLYFIARPVVGGHFALLALEKARGREAYEELFASV